MTSNGLSPMPNMTRQELIQFLESKPEVIAGCVAVAVVATHGEWRENVRSQKEAVGLDIELDDGSTQSFGMAPADVLKRYSNPNYILDDIANIMRLAISDAIRMSFEEVQDFCNRTNQQQSFKAFPWHHFVRIVRNSLSHTHIWNFNFKRSNKTVLLPSQTILLPDGKQFTIDNALHGTQITMESFPWDIAASVVKVIELSVAADLHD